MLPALLAAMLSRDDAAQVLHLQQATLQPHASPF